MIIYSEGTVFNTDAEAIVNTVNCKGVMGAGIALEFQLRYPKMFEQYVDMCEQGDIRIGRVNYYVEETPIIINFPTKYDYKYPSKIEWIEQGLKSFIDTYELHGVKSVAFPKLGAGRGGLDWRQVKSLMEQCLGKLDIEVIICEDTLPYAEGIEKKMVDKLNEMSISSISAGVRLTEKQKEAIEGNKPLKRFWHLSQIDSIGAKAYEKLFNYFYDISQNNDCEQLRLF